MTDIHVFTDGACSGNPGPGGWGVVILRNYESPEQSTVELCGGDPETTNNRMEMMATIKALEALQQDQGPIHIHTDSTYVKDGITLWVANWQKNGWKTANKKEVKNKDLWQILLEKTKEKKVQWHWVKGHAGHPQNERADVLARNGIMQVMMKSAVKNQMSQSDE